MSHIDTEFSEVIRTRNSLPRTHASIYDWHDKGTKEAGLVEEFLDPRNHKGQHGFTSFEIPEKDPPDAVVLSSDGKRVQLELVELGPVNTNEHIML